MSEPGSTRRARARARPDRGLAALALAAASAAAPLPGTAGDASAASNGQWSVFPTPAAGRGPQPYLTPLLTPGRATSGSVTIDKHTLAPLTLDLYAAYAFNTPDGGLSLRRRVDPQVGIGRWTHLGTGQVTVGRRGSANVPFVITTPRQAPRGEHVGGIVAEQTQGVTPRSGSTRVTLLLAVAVCVYARVRGPLSPHLAVSGVTLWVTRSQASQFGGPVDARVWLQVQNVGNTALTPRVRASLTTPFGAAGRRRTVTLPRLLPGSTVIASVAFADVPADVHLHAALAVQARGVESTVGVSRWVPPWGLVAVASLVLAAWAVRWQRRRRRAVGEVTTSGGASPTAEAPEGPAGGGEVSLGWRARTGRSPGRLRGGRRAARVRASVAAPAGGRPSASVEGAHGCGQEEGVQEEPQEGWQEGPCRRGAKGADRWGRATCKGPRRGADERRPRAAVAQPDRPECMDGIGRPGTGVRR